MQEKLQQLQLEESENRLISEILGQEHDEKKQEQLHLVLSQQPTHRRKGSKSNTIKPPLAHTTNTRNIHYSYTQNNNNNNSESNNQNANENPSSNSANNKNETNSQSEANSTDPYPNIKELRSWRKRTGSGSTMKDIETVSPYKYITINCYRVID